MHSSLTPLVQRLISLLSLDTGYSILKVGTHVLEEVQVTVTF